MSYEIYEDVVEDTRKGQGEVEWGKKEQALRSAVARTHLSNQAKPSPGQSPPCAVIVCGGASGRLAWLVKQ